NCAQGDDLQADLLVVGPCYTILTFVNGVQTDLDLVGGAATVSICDLNDVDGILANPPAFASHEQEELVSIIHFDNGDFYEALEHTAPVGCSTPIPSVAPRRSGVVGLARSVVDGVFGWLSPREAVANAAMIDRGGGGRTGSFRSNFRAALPSKIVVDASYPSDPNGDPLPGSAIVGGAVTPNPAILVIDANGEPVQGATVNFEIQPTIESTVNGSTTAAVTTNASGVADVSWVLATTNPQSLKAFARGMTAKTNPVIQPPPDNNDGVLDNVVLGNATFCQTNECASNDIIAESITFDATAVVLNLIGSSSRGGGGAGTGGLGTNPGSLFAIDPATGQATLIGSTDVNDCTGVPSMSDVDYQPGTGTIYGIIGSALRGGVLVTVDPATGAATVVGTLVGAGFDVSCGAGGGSDALAFTPDGRLFAGGWAGGFAGGSLLEIDPATGAVIATVQTFDQVNVGDNGHLAGLATDPQGQLWASRGGSNLGTIHTVDITSGITSTLQLVDSQGAAEFVHVSDIAFAADGTLYASLSRENMLATIDTQTGLLTRIGSYGAVVTRMSGLAALP
ncbi:MAG: hypothetical protein R3195_15325, partial [Gemmatimonadota bacterium]|nr:hypothetical protein [Gemmatimonadota bacterium]